MIQTLEIELADDLAPEVRKEITTKTLTVAKAIAVSMSIVGLSPDFDERSEKLIAEANAVPQVQTPEELEKATAAWKHLQAFRIEMRKEEDRLKGPLNEVKKTMMEMVEKGMAPTEKAEKRIADMINGYARERAEAEEKERNRIAAENAKIEADRQAAIAAAAKLEQDKKDAEARAAKAQQDAENAKGKAKAAAEEAARKAQQEADALEEEQLAASLATVAAPVAAAPAPAENPKGLTTKKVFDYRVVGKNQFEQAKSLIALAGQYPFLFSLTTEKVQGHGDRPTGLRLQRSAVLDSLNGRAPEFAAPPKGLEIFESFAASIR